MKSSRTLPGVASMLLSLTAASTALADVQLSKIFSDHMIVQQNQPIRLPPSPSEVRVGLFTPLRVKRHGSFVGAAEFEPSDLLRNLCMLHACGDACGALWR